MAKQRQVDSWEMLRDIRDGMTNALLMKKYRLSPQELQRVFTTLVEAGAVNHAELGGRASALQGTVNPAWSCPACGRTEPREFEECPGCGVIVQKYRSNPTPRTGSDTEQAPSARTKALVWVSVSLLLLGGLGAFWYHKSKVAEALRIEEQRRRQAEAKEDQLQQEAIREQREADERQLQQDREMENWFKREEERARTEETKQQKQTTEVKRAGYRIGQAYLKIVRVSRDINISLLGEDVSRGLQAAKPRIGEFTEALAQLKITQGTNPAVTDHFQEAFRHLTAAYSVRTRKEKFDSIRLWKQECVKAYGQIKASR
jgi:hypothetical protein